MKIIARLVTGSLFSLLVASYGFAADATPAASQQKPAATAQPAPAVAPSAAAPAATPPAAAPAASATAPAKEAGIKIAYIDMIKIASESKRGQAATASIKAKSDKLRKKIEAKQKQLEKQKAAIESKIDTLSSKERAAKGKEFQKKVEEYQKLVRSSEDEMRQTQEKLTTELYEDIKSTAASYAKSHGYTAVLEEKAVLYMSDSITPTDLTQEIAAAIDEKKAK